MKNALIITAISLCSLLAQAQSGPLFDHWWYNTDGNTVSGILTGIESLHYTNDYVYVSTSGVPAYYQTGQSVNSAADQNWTFRITRNPVEETGMKTQIGGAQIGLLISGASFFDPFDGQSWQNEGNWNRIAWYFEGNDFDDAYGHSTPTNIYHHHVDAVELHDLDSSVHSPLIGFAFDGYPLYGPFGYADPNDANSDVTRMKPSWQLRNISNRNTLPDGTVSPGPNINSNYPLGCFGEDWEHVDNSGHLDEYNGRWCVTPAYPSGTYAYFTTLDDNLDPRYPYFIGPYEYFGEVLPGNTGPTGGNNNIPPNATEYTPLTTTADLDAQSFTVEVYSNPTMNYVRLKVKENSAYQLRIHDMSGRVVLLRNWTEGENLLDISQLPAGIYVVSVTDTVSGYRVTNKLVKQ